MKKLTVFYKSSFLILFIFNLNFASCNEKKEELRTENEKTNNLPSYKNLKSDSSDYIIELVAENLYVPWSIVFTDSSRMLFTERSGNLRVILNGVLEEKPLKVFEEVSSEGEEGLMGLALDPEYKNNKLIFVSYAYLKNNEMKVKVLRYKDNGNELTEEKLIIDNLPAERYHAGCRLKFGPDNKLYITTGDAGEKELAQNINTLYGKILRINSDGSIPSDNPYSGNPVWSYGHRNAQGIDWYPGTEIMFSTEHGPSGFDGPGGGDEVNIIVKGGNYGWPLVSHKNSMDGMISPVLEFTPAIAPASGMFYKSDSILQFKNNYFFGCLRGSGIMRVITDKSDPEKVISFGKMDDVNFGRIREIAEGPDGAIYFSTSNRDGRGKIREGDDKIYRIIKK